MTAQVKRLDHGPSKHLRPMPIGTNMMTSPTARDGSGIRYWNKPLHLPSGTFFKALFAAYKAS